MTTLHLTIVGQAPVVEGPMGCDYANYPQYNFAAYRCLPHRWYPGSDWSYAQYQVRDSFASGHEDEGAPTSEPSVPPPPPAMIAPEADLYGDNALDDIQF